MGNRFGRLFQITTFGESHGPAIGVVIDGCPPRLPISVEAIQLQLDRRKPGQSRITTQRKESDIVEILSGVDAGLTTGTALALLVRNADARGEDYSEMHQEYRPSHADYTYQKKYGIRSIEGGGRASARETIGRVAAGAVADALLREAGIEVLTWVQSVEHLRATVEARHVTLAEIESNPVRCPDAAMATSMFDHIDSVRKAGDSVGGVVAGVARGVPVGLGAPVFDKLEACLGSAMLSIPAAKGFEVGSGFEGTRMRGSAHNDAFYPSADGAIRTRTNYSGGIQGGISNGENIDIRVAFKPTATILQAQETVTAGGEPTTLAARGRHDPCVLPRAVPIVEAMMRLVLADHLLLQRAQVGATWT
ncbi:MAG: chorismate synthase [Myxococcales bacterium]|nr:chorismate synthase [Myxococcales bacterium]